MPLTVLICASWLVTLGVVQRIEQVLVLHLRHQQRPEAVLHRRSRQVEFAVPPDADVDVVL